MPSNGTLRGSPATDDKARPTLLLVHPLGTGPDFWAPVMRHLPAFAWIAPDFRPDPRSEEIPALEAQSELLEAERTHAGADRCVVIGCAAGALITAIHASHHPEAVAGIVLINPAARHGPQTDAALAARAALVREKGIAALVPSLVDRIFNGCPKDAVYDAFTRRFAQQDAGSYARFLLSFRGADVAAALESLAMPALVMRGDRDVMASADDARDVHERLRHSTFVTLPDAAHFVPIQSPAIFAGLVERFISGLEAPGSAVERRASA